MELSEAKELIRCDALTRNGPALWADLGCGSGLFSHALAAMLPEGSTVYAIDKDNTFNPITADITGNEIQFIQSDFVTALPELPLLDRILMANSLHYVQHKERFLEGLLKHYRPAPFFLIVEYDISGTPLGALPYMLFRTGRAFCKSRFSCHP